MPYFVIERTFDEPVPVPVDAAAEINLINDEEDVRWVFSYLSLDRTKTYCLYEAPSADAIRAAAERAGLPADSVIEVAGRVMPTGRLVAAE
ncbi:DUF4242 domain-containing protein [Microbacterium sp. zg-YB36]|uniref:DUF4242 domain-containing protein n=1 Tax=Microbacterium sp. zg-YB36 TaxID=2969407 RepID=UPI00214B915A|nr:DUF4242 domain-containing protein [Microbacterium sp. zg-YB36]MDL5350908.1 DUF4242 domain-containing protein [Microbacterium sp. zg-YB36]